MKKILIISLLIFFLFGCTQQKLIALPASIDMNEINDVNIFLIQDNQILMYDSATAKWLNSDVNALPDVNNANFLDSLDSNEFVQIKNTQLVVGRKDFNAGAVIYEDFNLLSTKQLGSPKMHWGNLGVCTVSPNTAIPRLITCTENLSMLGWSFTPSLGVRADNNAFWLGSGSNTLFGDANMYYNGTDVHLNPQAIGSGDFVLDGRQITTGDHLVGGDICWNGDPNTCFTNNADRVRVKVGGDFALDMLENGAASIFRFAHEGTWDVNVGNNTRDMNLHFKTVFIDGAFKVLSDSNFGNNVNVDKNATFDAVRIQSDANATLGTAVLSVGGTVVVSNNRVTANSAIFLTPQNTSGVAGSVSITARTAGASFTISSSNLGDTRTIAWWIIEPN